MNTSSIKKYAPEARKQFIDAVTKRANLLGIYGDEKISDPVMTGGVMQIDGNSFDVALAKPRERLVEKVRQQGFTQLMEHVAYTWFNRFSAIRFMELQENYLGHGLRMLSHPDDEEGKSQRFEILEHAQDVADELGLDRAHAIELKLAANKEEELYRELLLGQCHKLHEAMPFLFETLNDETELLIPDNLTRTDSLVRNLVDSIPESDWQNVEVIGWLYQFYISEKKDEVIGKVVKSEDIPAATQLFTPNWIVKYMVQNSLGAQWLATYPESIIKEQMEYYIEPAEQTDEVNAQLAAITPGTLNPEELTLIDPACGSGHILVEAYDLFKAIYLERGYRQRDLAKLILEKNLFGLDIDERAAQLTGFALMMKGRMDDRRLFERRVKLNVMALVDSAGFDAEGLSKGMGLADYGLKPGDLTELKRLFEHATTFGSLIQVPEGVAAKLPALRNLGEATSQDLFVADALARLRLLVKQAESLVTQYDTVVANPPYIGGKFHIPVLKKFLKDHYKGYEKDVFSAFIDRNLVFSKTHGRLGFMSPFVWMFISSHEHLRARLIEKESFTSLVQLEYSGFDGATVPICTFTLQKGHVNRQKSCFIRLSDFRGSENQGSKTLEAIQDRGCGWFFEASQDEFKKIPGSPVAYWISAGLRQVFEDGTSLGMLVDSAVGLQTSDNDRFLRQWYEVRFDCIGFGMTSRADSQASKRKWFPYNKGGGFRRWYGNQDYVVNWKDDGAELFAFATKLYKSPTRIIKNTAYYFLPSMSWSDVTSGPPSFRVFSEGFIHDAKGMSAFHPKALSREILLGYCNTPIITHAAKALNPTLSFQAGNFDSLPIVVPRVECISASIMELASKLVALSTCDWGAYETSWDFKSLPILTASSEPTPTLESSYTTWVTQNRETITEMKRLEEENNRLFIDAYCLSDELTPNVPIEQITLTVNPAYRYGSKLTEEEQWTRFRQDSLAELVSYAIGCMMGRYSLDVPGLIYTHSGNEGFDLGSYTNFPADDDGIIPFTDQEWFPDDVTNRFREFIGVAWDEKHLQQNLDFVAENLKPKRGESNLATIRRYLSTQFFKDHLKTYKKRPIYWLFSSGKQKAFECLVYLHRYNEGTLSRMRTEYVTPLMGKYDAYTEQLTKQIDDASSTAEANKLKKQFNDMEKRQNELRGFDDKLKHYADMRISLDLDDGVKVNYAKFGDLLVDVKAVTGSAPKVK